MKHRKLRIAWSVAWGILAVLFVALWVHSDWDYFYISIPGTDRWLGSADGRINLNYWGGAFNSILRTQFSVPYWVLVSSATFLASLAWLPWWSNRFSLRTLLIATTLVAVGLGLIVWFAG